jgi:KaiC/GvpD/RAD55 family RecA-like ATPase
MKDKIFDKLPENQLFETLDFENLDYVVQQIKSAPPKENNCVIFDDCTAYLKNKDTLKLLKELIFNRRHLHTSIFFLTQTWYSVHKDIRKLFSNIFVFRVSRKEMETIMDETIERKREMALEIVRVVFDKPYQFLFINTDTQKMYKNFDELIFSEDEENLNPPLCI